MPSSRTEPIAMPDGGTMEAYLALPAGGSGQGIVVLMEIFGVGVYIREAADRLAGEGYVALAPDLYRHVAPGAEYTHDRAGLAQAGQTVSELDGDGAVADAMVALEHLCALPESTGPAGVLGFCLGGTLAYRVAAAADPATAVSYYGSSVADLLGLADQIACPVQFHFGGLDTYIPREQAERVAAVAALHPGWECHIQSDAGHAFDNWDAPMFSAPEAAARAWALTRDFLHRTLPVSQPA